MCKASGFHLKDCWWLPRNLVEVLPEEAGQSSMIVWSPQMRDMEFLYGCCAEPEVLLKDWRAYPSRCWDCCWKTDLRRSALFEGCLWWRGLAHSRSIPFPGREHRNMKVWLPCPNLEQHDIPSQLEYHEVGEASINTISQPRFSLCPALLLLLPFLQSWSPKQPPLPYISCTLISFSRSASREPYCNREQWQRCQILTDWIDY